MTNLMSVLLVLASGLWMNEFVAAEQNQGSCTQVELVIASAACMRRLFLSFRTNPKQECRSQINGTVRVCMDTSLESCFAKPISESDQAKKDEFINTALESGTVAMFCDDATPIATIPVTPENCTGSFDSAYENCTTIFNRHYKKNKAEPGLCSEYDRMLSCVRSAGTSHCPKAVWDAYNAKFGVLLKRESNPFCSSKQLHGSAVAMASASSFVLPLAAAVASVLLQVKG